MELTDELKTLFIETAKTLKGFERRRFQAQTVKALGHGGQRRVERELGWNRKTLRKAMHALESGLQCFDAISTRRRKRAEGLRQDAVLTFLVSSAESARGARSRPVGAQQRDLQGRGPHYQPLPPFRQ